MAGSLERRDNGKWRLVYSKGSGQERRRYTKVLDPCTKKQADKELALFIAECERADKERKEKGITFAEFRVEFITLYASKKAENTREGYEGLLRTRINKYFDGYYLQDIKAMDVVKFLDELRAEGLSGNTVSHYYKLLSLMLKTAVGWEYIEYNPIYNVDAPRFETKEIDFYNVQECARLFEVLERVDLKYKIGILIAVTGGLRLGEIAALTWMDVDFDRSTISVNKSMQSNGKIKAPKTKAGKRVVSLPKMTLDALEDFKKVSGNGAIFDGMHHNTLSKGFSKIIADHGLKRITFHQLRHTAATLLINNNLNVSALAKKLGHSKTSTTLNVYAHAYNEVDTKSSEIMDSLFTTKGTAVTVPNVDDVQKLPHMLPHDSKI